jgi:hypothetical protein
VSNLSNDESKEIMEVEYNLIVQEDNHLQFKESILEFDKKEEKEAKAEEDIINLQGIELNRVASGEEEREELARARFKATPRILFGGKDPSSQPIDNPIRQGMQSS